MERTNDEYETIITLRETAEEEQVFNLFAMLKPSLKKDGDQWCVLYGEDLQSGIAGFGASPFDAIMNFNRQWYKPMGKENP